MHAEKGETVYDWDHLYTSEQGIACPIGFNNKSSFIVVYLGMEMRSVFLSEKDYRYAKSFGRFNQLSK